MAADAELRKFLNNLPSHECEVLVKGIIPADNAEQNLKKQCEQDLRKLCRPFGEVDVFMRHKYAFVYFKNKALALKAIDTLDKDHVKGMVIRVTPTKNKLFISWKLSHDSIRNELIEKAVTQFDIGVLKVELTMEQPGSGRKDGLIIIEYKSQAFAEYAEEKVGELGNEVIISSEDPRIKAKAQQPTKLPYIIGDQQGYIDFIVKHLRKNVVDRDGNGVVLKDIFDDRRGSHPVLTEKPSDDNPAEWIQIELQVGQGDKMRATTLAVRRDNLYVHGFKNQKGDWFELGGSDQKLPKAYRSKKLPGWDVQYKGMMNLVNAEQVEKTLTFTRLGKAFAESAVRRLSCYRVGGNDDDNPTRLGLAGLVVMLCEAARMNPCLDTIAGAWTAGTGLTSRMAEVIWDWSNMSAALLKWKESGYREWPIQRTDSPGHALASVHLVLNTTAKVEGADPAWVEIFSVKANFPPDGVTIKLFNEENQGHIIHKKVVNKKHGKKLSTTQDETTAISSDHNSTGGDHDEKDMVPLELTARRRCISGYEWFGMEVVIPSDNSPRKFKWACRKQGGDATEVVTREINFNDERKMEVTYLVMPDAVKAKVEVKLRYRYGYTFRLLRQRGLNCHGEIAARIDGFDHRIVLFRKSESETATTFAGDLTLQLVRSDVWVPRGRPLHIDMKSLHITADGKGQVSIPASLRFNFGELSPSGANDDFEVEVNISWDLPQEQITVNPGDKVMWVVVDDAGEYTACIEELRSKVANVNPCQQHVLEDYTDTDDLTAIGKRPILAKPDGIKAKRCVHLELQAGGAGEETWSTTLAVRDDYCEGVGFMNQSGVWYDLGYCQGGDYDWRDKILPAQYNSVFLGWGVRYDQILHPTRSDWENWKDVRRQLNKERLGKDFVTKAVQTLSRYPDLGDDISQEKDLGDDIMNPRLAVVGLMIVFCESAKLDFLCKSFQNHWGRTGVELTEAMMNYVLDWEKMSGTLLHWKYHLYRKWPQNSDALKDALNVVHLVLNRHALGDQIDMTYTIGDDKGYTSFIEDVRSLVTRQYRDTCLRAGVLPMRGDGPVWWNIQLKVAGKETSSTTLALKGDDLCICGFMGQNKVWYGIAVLDEMFKQEYAAVPLQLGYGMLAPREVPWGDSMLVKTNAVEAVRTLSRYRLGSGNNWRVCRQAFADATERLGWPLMILQLIVSYSASIIPVHKAVEQGWLKATILDRKLQDFVSRWDDMSVSALQDSPQEDAVNAFALIKKDALKSG